MIAPPAGAPLQVSIDNQLGDAQDRYFGLGFLRVEHTVASHTLSKHRGLFEVAASYPLDWSKKNQKPQTAHLSSVDALVLTARVVELWLQHQGLARRVAGAWFSKCELRPGRTPVDVSQPLIARLDVSLADGTHGNLVMDARCRIAEFSVSITLQIPPQADGIESKVTHSHYFAQGYRSVPRWLGEVSWTTSSRAECPVQIGVTPETPFSGLESAHGNVVSFVDAMLVAAQIGQVLLYNLDDVHRGETETMWLRRATFSRSHPPSGPIRNESAVVDLVRTQLLERSGARWRTIDLRAQVAGIDVNYSLTHQLQDSTRAAQSDG